MIRWMDVDPLYFLTERVFKALHLLSLYILLKNNYIGQALLKNCIHTLSQTNTNGRCLPLN